MKIIFPRMETTHFHKAYDGGCKFIQGLAEELARKGHEVEIVTTKLRDSLELEESVYNGVRHKFILPKYTGRRLVPFNMFYKMLFSYKLNKYLKKKEFDILHNSEALAYFYLHNKVRKKVVFQSWALEPFYGHESCSQGGIRKFYVRQVLQRPWRYCLQHADSVTADDETQIPQIVKLGVNPAKIDFIPLGLPFKKIQKERKNFKNIRGKLGISSKDLVLLTVGQVVPEKGIEEIIRGFALIGKKLKNSKLIIIGKGSFEDKMDQLIIDLKLNKDIIHLKDIPESDLFNYHFSSDIFINGTHTNYPTLSVQEAMANGLPVVSGSSLFLIKEGVNGYSVGIKNPKGIAEGVIKIYKNGKMRSMGKESIKMVKDADYDNIAKTAIKVYQKLLNKG